MASGTFMHNPPNARRHSAHWRVMVTEIWLDDAWIALLIGHAATVILLMTFGSFATVLAQ